MSQHLSQRLTHLVAPAACGCAASCAGSSSAGMPRLAPAQYPHRGVLHSSTCTAHETASNQMAALSRFLLPCPEALLLILLSPAAIVLAAPVKAAAACAAALRCRRG